MIDYSLYLVTDDPSRYAGNWLDNVVAAVEGGVTCVQYRDTESLPAERLARVRALRDALAGRAPIIVNNDAELAATVRAEGVHVGQGDLPPAAIRAIVGPDCEIGLSITALSQLADAARLMCADAFGIGPVFDARKTKADAAPALGLEGLSEIVAKTKDTRRETRDVTPLIDNRLPVIAIGGITLANAADVLATGVDGLAVVSSFSKSDDPYETAKNFTLLLDHCRQ